MKIILSAIIGISLLTGCGPVGPVSDEVVTKNLHYFQDKRTHICYAYWKGGAITQVPCADVQALVDNNWNR